MRVRTAVLAMFFMGLGGGVGCDRGEAQADPGSPTLPGGGGGHEPGSGAPDEASPTTGETAAASLDYDGAVRVVLTGGAR